MAINKFKNIGRLNRIVVTLIRYGFGGLVSRMRIVPFISTLERVFVSKKNVGKLTEPERVRLVLEDLGPTFIKLGQIASTRADLLPTAWIDEFKKLQDMVPPFPYEEVRKVVEKSLGAPVENIFSSFAVEPVASASIAQVHLAELRDGTAVAVKVKRPGIERIIASDMSVMHTVAGLLVKYVPQSRRYRPEEVVHEFEKVIIKEQDFTIEGGNIDLFYNMFKDDPDIQIPMVWWDYTTEDVLTMERISGTPIDEVARIRDKGVDIKKVAVKGIELFFRQVFDYGVFHADLHPGNIFVRDDGVIIYLDFGIIGRLDRGVRKYLASMLYYLIKKDYYRMALVHRDMKLIDEDVDIYEFEDTLRDISEPIFGRTLEHINISALLMKLIHTARRFNMRLQPNLLLLQKSMVIIEGVGRQLYPEINMWDVAGPLVTKWMIKEKFSPKALYEKGTRGAEDLMGAALDIPVNMNSLITKALKDEIRIGFVHHRLDEVAAGLDSAGRRVAGGFLAGSIVVASALVAVFAGDGGVELLGVPVVSVVGFILALVLGVWAFAGRAKR
ncbi:MAG: AarF/ABC1/UbiB kinase family protein [Thermodesulfobacteriota bacterium]|nr:MAG: AarF/ABC1/UbiB kinase family protein [Thermodesulfobacteriota bacterium]